MAKFGIMATGIAWLILISSSYAADVAKIGVVDMQRIAENSSAGKAAKAMLKGKFDELKNELSKKGNELEQLKKQIEREAMVMSSAKREEKEREYRIKMNDFKSLRKNYEKDMQGQNLKIMNAIRKDVSTLIGNIGKKEGYLLVVERSPFVYYAPQSIDLTDQVIQQYNALFAGGTAEASKLLK